jgi:hypothetical protein
MPGLFVMVQPGTPAAALEEAARAPLAALAGDGAYAVRVAVEDGFAVGEIAAVPRGFSRQTDPHLAVWAYGSLYGPGSASPAAALAGAYRPGAAAWPAALNGEFTAVILDRDRNALVLLNDRIGMRPWYTADCPGGFLLSPEVKGTPAVDGEISLDEESVAAVLAFNKIRLGDRTLLKGVRVLPAASLWRVDLASGKTERQVYWRYRYSDSMDDAPPPDETLDLLADRFRAAMRLRTEGLDAGVRIGLSLSGGLDSRAMAAALPPERAARVHAHTYGLPDSDEVRLAEAVARTAGLRQTVYPQDADVYTTHAAESRAFNDELDLFVQGGQLHWMRRARETTDVMLTGLDLDVTLGGIYLRPDVMAARDDGDVLDLLCRHNAVFTAEELKTVLSDRLYRAAGRAPYERAAGLIAALPQEQPAAKYDLFIQQYSMRRIIMLRYALIRHFMDTATPMYDPAFNDAVRGLALPQRAAHRTFVPVLHRLSPALESIPYQRTLLPPSAPREFWARSQALEAEREALYTDLWRATNGRVYVPYRRYYTNFDEWLRVDPAWRALTDALLLAPDARVYARDLVRPRAVAELVEQHRTAARNRRQALVTLMSLELYLRS